MSSIKKRPNGMWRARYRDAHGKEHARHFKYKDNPRDPENSAQHWIDGITAALRTGTYVDPRHANTTVSEWCDLWIAGYTKRPRSVSQAKTQIKHIKTKFGDRSLGSIRPSEVKTWIREMQDAGLAKATVRGRYQRFSQIFSDAVHDGLIPRSPASTRTSPDMPDQRPYVATTQQIWAIYYALPEHLRGIVLLGAFAGLRRSELVALRVQDVDFMRGVISPKIQYPADPLKTEESKNPIPIPQDLALELNRMPAKWGSDTIIVSEIGRPITPKIANKVFQEARVKVEELPTGFRIQDLRHYYASMLIASGADVKVVQARLRHKSAKTTLDIYGHLWPDSDESSRQAVAAVFADRPEAPADSLRTDAARFQ
ncbi:tyrosine-type recombinase/integrase [Leucobacter tardus]|nr:site-specific integrase [Leucobacter tardus]